MCMMFFNNLNRMFSQLDCILKLFLHAAAFTTEETSQDKRSQTCMLHVQDIAGLTACSLFVFSCVEKGIEFCSDSRRVFGF